MQSPEVSHKASAQELLTFPILCNFRKTSLSTLSLTFLPSLPEEPSPCIFHALDFSPPLSSVAQNNSPERCSTWSGLGAGADHPGSRWTEVQTEALPFYTETLTWFCEAQTMHGMLIASFIRGPDRSLPSFTSQRHNSSLCKHLNY